MNARVHYAEYLGTNAGCEFRFQKVGARSAKNDTARTGEVVSPLGDIVNSPTRRRTDDPYLLHDLFFGGGLQLHTFECGIPYL